MLQPVKSTLHGAILCFGSTEEQPLDASYRAQYKLAEKPLAATPSKLEFLDRANGIAVLLAL